MRRPRDSQKARLYDAERVTPTYQAGTFGGTGRRFATIVEIESFVIEVLDSRWFQARWGRRMVAVEKSQGTWSRAYGRGLIVMGHRDHWQPMIVLHELAHTVTDPIYAGHGKEFAAAYLALVGRFIGAEAEADLRAAFIERKVKHRWAIPAQPEKVVTKTATAQRQKEKHDAQFGSPASAFKAAETIRWQIKAGLFGPAGSASRKAALATARSLSDHAEKYRLKVSA